MGRHGVSRHAFHFRPNEDLWDALNDLREIDNKKFGELSMNLFLESLLVDVVRDRREELELYRLRVRGSRVGG